MIIEPGSVESESCPKEYVDFAHQLADLGGDIHRRYFRHTVKAEIKPDGSPVTKADRETEEVIRELLEKKYPSHGILGEEYPPTREDAEFVWLLDPLDGTESFLAGIPLFGLLIGLAWRRRFILGLIDQAILRERWLGADGHGTMLNGKRVSTRKCASLQEAVLHTDGPVLVGAAHDDAIALVGRRCSRIHYGIECYSYGLLASGYIDLIIDHGLDNHDYAPLEPVVRNAGGEIRDWQGKRLGLDSEGAIVAVADPRLLEEVIKQLYPTSLNDPR